MKNTYFILAMALIMSLALASASPELVRNLPTTVSPGQTFTVTYTHPVTPSGNWFVAWEDSVTGGCAPANYKAFLANGGTGSTTFTAPASGSCTFTGYYQYTNNAQTNFPSATVTVTSSGNTTCTPVHCAASTCTNKTCTNNCGATEAGTKTDGTCATSGGSTTTTGISTTTWIIIGIVGLFVIVILMKK